MESAKFDLKIYLDDAADVTPEAFISIFHRWIQEQRLDELFIDVADYRHVPNGPGVMLIAHDAHYAMDMSEGQLGLLYSRRRETHATRRSIQSLEERLASIFSCALTACQHLEAEGQLRFRTDRLLLRHNDRLQAPSAEAHDRLRMYLEPLLDRLYPGSEIEMEYGLDPTSRLTIAIRTADAPDIATLLARLEAQEAGVGR